jgi:protein ImuA
MQASKTEIITQLKKEILALQGFKVSRSAGQVDVGLGPILDAFPEGCFPLGAVHEFICEGLEDYAATGGFITALLAPMMPAGGATLWISSKRTLFPPALKSFGIEPERVVFVDLPNESDVAWVMEEALKCAGLSAVVGEMGELSFTTSRRLQLAVEQSRVTGFILRNTPRKLGTTACVSRWKISSLPSEPAEGLPGIGFPRWNVELLKVRNGSPGTWQIEWAAGTFRLPSRNLTAISLEQKKKTG